MCVEGLNVSTWSRDNAWSRANTQYRVGDGDSVACGDDDDGRGGGIRMVVMIMMVSVMFW